MIARVVTRVTVVSRAPGAAGGGALSHSALAKELRGPRRALSTDPRGRFLHQSAGREPRSCGRAAGASLSLQRPDFRVNVSSCEEELGCPAPAALDAQRRSPRAGARQHADVRGAGAVRRPSERRDQRPVPRRHRGVREPRGAAVRRGRGPRRACDGRGGDHQRGPRHRGRGPARRRAAGREGAEGAGEREQPPAPRCRCSPSDARLCCCWLAGRGGGRRADRQHGRAPAAGPRAPAQRRQARQRQRYRHPRRGCAAERGRDALRGGR